ncbi:disks large homolog 5-like [Rattus norvegicus]|uniref:disks large homolog 5-like n=1 Tax=Rattus norvegicus TaxID=10116 RepID=UPI001917608E|nr:disks large homolog 5-like isoform X1 [Rattus norvegicus]
MFSRLRKRFGRGNVDSGETRVKESGLSSQSNDGQRQHFWRMFNAGRETSSPETALSEKQAKKEKERLIKELQLITEERNDLRYRLRFLTERSKNNRPHFRPNPYYEDLERMEEVVMSILHNLEMENTEIHENSHKLKKEITFSRNLLSQLLMENTCRKKLVPQKQGSKEGHLDCALNQKYLVDFNKKDKDQQRPDPASSGLRKCKRTGIGHTPVRELPEE